MSRTKKGSGDPPKQGGRAKSPKNPDSGGRPVMAIAAKKNIPAVRDAPAIGGCAVSSSDSRPCRTRSAIRNNAAAARVE